MSRDTEQIPYAVTRRLRQTEALTRIFGVLIDPETTNFGFQKKIYFVCRKKFHGMEH